ncbi:MAG: PAS domain S-box protein [Pseudomonadales bacterium]|nr:PAS domain S-box protein [Pseudomonadales bacterium]
MSAQFPYDDGDPAARMAAMTADALLQVVATTSSVIAIKDAEGRYRYVNDAFVALLGGRVEDYLGQSDAEIFDPALAARLRANDHRVLKEGREIGFEEELLIAGAARTFETRKYPLRRRDGRIWGICLSAQDVTERKQTNDALQSIALGIAAATGPRVLELTVESVARTLGVRFAFVSAIEPGTTPRRLATLATRVDGVIGPVEIYVAAGTPCECVLDSGFQYWSGDVQGRFSADEMLIEGGYTSYAGYPLVDGTGNAIGVLAVLHGGPLPERAVVEALLSTFAVRSSAELERLRMDQALRESEESYRNIFEATDDCIFVHDMQTGAIVDANPRASEVYGYSHAELLALRPGDLGTGEEPYTDAGAAASISRATAGESVRVEWHRRNKDGSTAWDEVTLKRVRLAGVDRILAVTRDISERKEREQALMRSEDRLRATVRAALDCIITMDASGCIHDFNPAAEATFGYRAADVLGRPLADLIIPERDRAAHRAGLARHLAGGGGSMLGRRVEVTAQHADGSEFPVEIAIGVAAGTDQRLYIGYLRDITERRVAERARERLELKLRQAQKMEAIGHLTGGIAHDFNNILTGIMGYLAMGTETARQLGEPRLVRQLDRAHHSAARAAELIQQMLTFSRGQRGNPVPVRLEPVVRDALRLVRSTLPATIEVVFDPGSDSDPKTDSDPNGYSDPAGGLGGGPRVLADPVQVEQVLMNLCINARDAMQGHGRIRIGLGARGVADAVCSACHEPVEGSFVELSVTDSGPGVPAAVVDRIFDPFFSTKAPGQGSGMGLATVHGIVHEHHGHIVLGRGSDGGACFRVLLPSLAGPAGTDGRQARAVHAANAQPVAKGPLAGQVMLVEDDPTARDFMAELLEEWGLEVQACSDPLVALAAFETRDRDPDLVMVDYTMPHMNGFVLAGRLHARRPGVPLLLYSGHVPDLTSAELDAAGIVALLRKPVDTARLFAELERHLPAR